MEQEPGEGPFRVGKGLPVWLRCRRNRSSMPVFATRTHGRVGVQLHVGAPAWQPTYELSKNLHR
jgi:hypothetical protein